MGIGLGLLLSMGTLSVGGVIVEKVLGKFGKVDEANMVSMISTTCIAGTALTCVANLFIQIKGMAK